MLFPILFLLIFFSLNNSKRAQIKGLKPVVWVFYTILAFSIAVFLSCFLLGVIIMVKNPSLLALAQANDRAAMNEFMLTNFTQNDFLYSSLIMAGAFGGYLFIRYLIDKKKVI
jgi:hypothetical protein